MLKNKPVKTENVTSKELTTKDVEKKINPIVSKVESLEIKSEADMKTAAEYLFDLSAAEKMVTARMETITKPAKEAIKAAEAIWKPFITQSKKLIQIIRDKQSEYQTEKIRIQREEENKIAKRMGEGKGKLKVETAMRKIDEVEKPSSKISVDSGSTGFREEKCFEVMDITMLPHEYVLPNEVKIRSAMKGGIELSGVRYFTKMIPVNKRV